MPAKDGTGPFRAGARNVTGFGPCANTGDFAKMAGLGLGLGHGMACHHGFRHGARRFPANSKIMGENRGEILQARKDALKNQIAAIGRQMDSL